MTALAQFSATATKFDWNEQNDDEYGTAKPSLEIWDPLCMPDE